MLQSRLLPILGLLFCHVFVGCINPNAERSASASSPANGRTNGRPVSVDKIRDVEAVDPGLLAPIEPAPRNTTHGKQFSNVPGQGGSFGGNSLGGSSFGNNLGGEGGFQNQQPGSVFSSNQPGVRQTGGFLPGQGEGFGIGQGGFVPGQGGFPGQAGGFPGAGGFPQGGGIPPGATLPPGSVSPDTVAFSASRASDFTRVGITQVRFDITLTDIGYGWYPDRSEFVCYYPGLYYFAFSGLSPQTRQFKLSLVRNNQEVVSAWGDSNGYQMASNTAILVLNQGDRVYLVLQEGNLHEAINFGRGYTTFSGFRIR